MGSSSDLTDAEVIALAFDWRGFVARPNQVMPADLDWLVWLILTGRGWGKTRCGAESVREVVESGECKRIALGARTSADARDTMIEGNSGILSVSRPDFYPIYEPSKRRLTWPNGSIATAYSADEPDLLRGPQHDFAWCDELAAWKYAEETWDNLMLGLRLGKRPRCVVTTTPKPRLILRKIIADELTRLTTGSTRENLSNLAETFKRTVLRKYEGTTLGRQELDGEMLEETPGALWKLSTLDDNRVTRAPSALRRIVVAVDPSVTSGSDSAECGIVVVAKGDDGHGYVLSDLSERLSPDAWARKAVNALKLNEGDRIVGEVNNGGDLVESVIRSVWKDAPYTAVRASRGKVTRAEPIAALYEQKRVHHVGVFGQLEDQMRNFTGAPGEDSPDRMDALVWGLTELFEGTVELVAPAGSVDMAPVWKP